MTPRLRAYFKFYVSKDARVYAKDILNKGSNDNNKVSRRGVFCLDVSVVDDELGVPDIQGMPYYLSFLLLTPFPQFTFSLTPYSRSPSLFLSNFPNLELLTESVQTQSMPNMLISSLLINLIHVVEAGV